VTVQSYDGRLDYGLIACRRAVPDINDLGDFLLAEHLTLLARAQEHAAAALAKEQEAAKAPATKRPANKAAPKTQAAVATAKPKSGKGKLALVSAEPAPVPRKRAAAKRTPAKRAAA
jgi:diacylglycerol O-acyltransferase / wax synthase